MKIAIALLKLPTWNSRLADPMSKEEIDETRNLAESFKTQGQIQAIEVEDMGDGGYLLVVGNRRRCAAIIAGWTEIEATVKPPSNDNERMLRNIIENVKRKNLTSFEEARSCAQMRAAGMSLKDIESKLGYSYQKVSNLAVTYDTLCPPILDAWRSQHPCATDTFLRALATEKNYPTPQSQMEAWDERCRLVAERDAAMESSEDANPDADPSAESADADAATEEKPERKGIPVVQARLKWVIACLDSKKGSPGLTDADRNLCRALVSYIIDKRDTTPDGMPNMPVKVVAVPLTEEEKAARKAEKAAESARVRLLAAETAAKEATEKARAAKSGATPLVSATVTTSPAPSGKAPKALKALTPVK